MQIAAGLKNLGLPAAPAKADAQSKVNAKADTRGQVAFGKGKSEQAPASKSSFSEILEKKNSPEQRSADNSSDERSQNNSEAREENLNVEAPISEKVSPTQPSQVMQAVSPLKTSNAKQLQSQQTSDTPETPAESDALTRRVVWNDFLRKMNSLGVSAEKVMKAFSSLTVEELAKPPEQTVDKLAMALGLNPTQTQAAKSFFVELINKTKSETFSQELKSPDQGARLSMLNQVEQKKQQTTQKLDNMNRDFFRNAPVKEEKPAEEQPVAAAVAKPSEEVKPEAPAAMSRRPELQNFVKPQIANSGKNTAAINKAVSQMQPVKPADAAAIQEAMKSAPKKLEQMMAQNVAAAPMAAVQAPVETAPQAVQMPALNALIEKLNLTPKDKNSSNSEDGDAQDSSNTLGQDLTQNVIGAQGKAEFQGHLNQAAGAQAPAQAQQVMTMPELVQQAQVMLRDGGGDMKVTLKQEGLGEVAMKVSVDGGKVSVAMVTQTDEAKKLLEHSVADLKSTLPSNHLQVDSIKIDTSAQLKAQLENQYQDAQRQQTQAQWEQFRQDTGAWKRNYFDTSSLGGAYNGQGRGPRDIAAPQATATSTRRLNLVA